MRAGTVLRFIGARVGLRPCPLHLDFEVTHLCNLSCRYCDRHTRRPAELTHEEALAALKGFVRLGLADISLDGGDPFTRPRIDDLIAWLADQGVTVKINTNGILVPRHRNALRRVAKLSISLDGPREIHDGMRGEGAFDHTLRAIRVAQEVGVTVSLTCTVARHNAAALEQVLDLADEIECAIVFQPARHSLVRAGDGTLAPFQLEPTAARAAFAWLEAAKRRGRRVANRWASLRHLRTFPEDTELPCAGGWIGAAMDPRGRLYPCGVLPRDVPAPSVPEIGAAAAFRRLRRVGCAQCWCARIVEGNYAWGARVGRMLPA